jgi:hypothetical protein
MTTTNRDVDVTIWEAQHPTLRQTVTIPAGTRCVLVDQPMGVAWAVDDVPLLVRLTGNRHDAVHRYVFLPLNAVGEG